MAGASQVLPAARFRILPAPFPAAENPRSITAELITIAGQRVGFFFEKVLFLMLSSGVARRNVSPREMAFSRRERGSGILCADPM